MKRYRYGKINKINRVSHIERERMKFENRAVGLHKTPGDLGNAGLFQAVTISLKSARGNASIWGVFFIILGL